MIRSNVALASLAWLLAAPAAMAVSLCDGPCSVSMGFPSGGAITAADGATLTFGPEGGLLELGEGGSINLGEGGSFTPLEGGPGNLSQGGSIVLGPGGSISFGSGGSLATGTYGAVATEGALDIVSAGSLTIHSDGNLSIGDVDAGDGDIIYTAGNTITQDLPPLVAINFHGTGADADVTVTTGGDLRIGMISTRNGSAHLTASGGFVDGDDTGGEGGSGGYSGSGLCASTGGSTDPCGTLLANTGSQVILTDTGLQIPQISATPVSRPSAGSLGALTLLGLGLAGLLGFRRR